LRGRKHSASQIVHGPHQGIFYLKNFMILSPAEMIAVEEEAFASGVTAEELMELAGLGIFEVVQQFFPIPGLCHVFYGKGNNGGDALVAARHMARAGWEIRLESPFAGDELNLLAGKKLQEFLVVPSPVRAGRFSSAIVLDGLLGLGASGEPRAPIADAIRRIHQLQSRAGVFAVDVPTGLDAATGVPASLCVRADITIAIGFVKSGLLADSATGHVGRLACVPLPALRPPVRDSVRVCNAETLSTIFPPRAFDMHKGLCGRIGIVAGSPGFSGAANLSSLGAIAAGGGLVTLFADSRIAELLASRCPAEVMVRPTSDVRCVLEENLDVLAIGPGLGLSQSHHVLTVIREAKIPVIVDADALNALASDTGLLKKACGPRILTPHPGEMERLTPQNGRARRQWAEDFSASSGATVLLKGSRTIVASPGKASWFNTTGNPGMAGGGMGDVLTGVIAALVGQQPTACPADLSALGAWLCGRAAERALLDPETSPESLVATDVPAHLGGAFQDLRRGAF
jgi:NAD(P)H-hydrate epimerase